MKLDAATEVQLDAATEPALDALDDDGSTCDVRWRATIAGAGPTPAEHRCVEPVAEHRTHRCRCRARLTVS